MYLKSILLILPMFESVLPGQSYVIKDGILQHANPHETSGKQIITESSEELNILGGVETQNPKNAEFKQLAEESLQKYLEATGITEPHKVVEILKASVQVVGGTLTRLEFTVQPLVGNNGDILKCNSKVWERLWLKQKEITVNCKINSSQKTFQSQDPNDPKFMQLAKESLQMYLEAAGIKKPHKVVRVDKARMMVLDGTSARLEFTVKPLDGNTDDVIKCTSKISKSFGLVKKEIFVVCINNTGNRYTVMENEETEEIVEIKENET